MSEDESDVNLLCGLDEDCDMCPMKGHCDQRGDQPGCEEN
jgi:hypothetical protein